GGTPGRQFGSPFAGVNLPTSGIAGHPVGGARGAYAGLPGLIYPGQMGGLAVGPGRGFGDGSAPGGAGATGAPSGPDAPPGQAGGLAVGPRGGFGYGGSLGSAGSAGAPPPGQAGGLAGGLGRG
ncbi:unnamed protein product, partial [Laminaria digitata]